MFKIFGKLSSYGPSSEFNIVASEPFVCDGRAAGYYADVASDCQQYHVCSGGKRQFTYSCPNTTRFQQRMMICDHWYLVDCGRSEQDFGANLLIGQRGVPFVRSEELYPNKPLSRGFELPLYLRNNRNISNGAERKLTAAPFNPTKLGEAALGTTGRTTLFNRLGGSLQRPSNQVSEKPFNTPSTPTKTITNTFLKTGLETLPFPNIRTTLSFLQRFPSFSTTLKSTTTSPRWIGTTASPLTFPTPVLRTTIGVIPTTINTLYVERTTPSPTSDQNIFLTERPFSFEDNTLEGRSLRHQAPYRLEWTLPDTRAMLFIPDKPEDAVAPNIKKFSVTIPQPRMNFREDRGENPIGPCPGNCHPAFMQPGTCIPCVMIK